MKKETNSNEIAKSSQRENEKEKENKTQIKQTTPNYKIKSSMME